MPRIANPRARTTTAMSCQAVAGALVLALAYASSARADFPDGTDRRHQVGLQAGGSSVFQIVYRYRVIGPVHLDLGGLGVPHSPINLSLGLIVAAPRTSRLYPYAGAGAGHAGIERPKDAPPGCYADMLGCPTAGDYLFYIYARAGIGVALGETCRHTLGLDVGAWYGRHDSRYNDGAGSQTTSSKTIVWPMAGLSYLYAL